MFQAVFMCFSPYLAIMSGAGSPGGSHKGCFSPYLGTTSGGGGGCPLVGSHNGWVHNLLMQFFTLGSSKIDVLETYFLDTMIT